MSTYKQNAVSKVVWPWTEPPAAKKQDPRPSVIVALLSFCVGAAVAYFVHSKGHPIPAYVIGSIASIILICSLFIPAAYAKIHAVLQKFALLVGTTLTYVLLVPFFYIAFPIGRISQLIKGKDPMNRKYKPDQASYWEDRPKIKDLEYYRRQS